MAGRRPLVAGNWKMNGLRAAAAEFEAVCQGYDKALQAKADLMICPPVTLIMAFADRALGRVLIGAQDCAPEPAGAFTGDISAEMLKDAGASAVIVGHSERRAGHGETDALVRVKAQAAFGVGFTAIICVGETKAERDAGKTLEVVSRQLQGSVPERATAASTVIAYEPVWAIGTGITPTPAQAAEVHSHIRGALSRRFGSEAQGMRILYGGSVKPDNA
ncbi:MAG TPA: triose-phosphate isomerase, partial [Xanthobacteraceae bacterium]|nr:triose-phosphate isomerase [Xanthobacteraceae bacterium]